jgi:hypothetical protein
MVRGGRRRSPPAPRSRAHAVRRPAACPRKSFARGSLRSCDCFSPGPVRHLVLLLSGDGGWGPALDAIAQRLALAGTAVVEIDVREWLEALEHAASTCVSPGASLAQLGRSLRARYGLRERPVLVGHSAAATLAYVALAQGRVQDFRGAVTLSFCVDLDLAKRLCAAPALRATPRAPPGCAWRPAAGCPYPGSAFTAQMIASVPPPRGPHSRRPCPVRASCRCRRRDIPSATSTAGGHSSAPPTTPSRSRDPRRAPGP